MGDADTSTVLVKDVSYSYHTDLSDRRVLNNVSMQIDPGEIVILTGPSGSGKTTLITLIGALRAAQDGSVKVLDNELLNAKERDLARVRKEVGYIFQQHNLLESLTVAQNVTMALQLDKDNKVSRKEARERVTEVLGQVGLEEHIDKYPKALSGGQKQRVGIARALVNKPTLILADEPTASLDKESGRNVVNLIQHLCREQGASVVLVTHDNRILDVADRILHLEDGEIKSISEAMASSTSQMLKLLDQHDPASSQYLSAFSVALTRVALADGSIDESETETIRRVLNETSDLQTGEVDLVMELAQTQVRCRAAAETGAESLFTPDQSHHFVQSLHAVAAADGKISPEELQEIREIAAEFGFPAEATDT
ncbi:MAG: ATP-binding cassette domain-containing protein [Halioglobus sp.]